MEDAPTQPLLWGCLVGLLALTIDSWWFWRNWQLYGDPSTTSLLGVLLGERDQPATVEAVRDLLKFVGKAYWLDFSPGGILFADAALYWILGIVNAIAMVGAIIACVRRPVVRPLLLLTWGWFALVLIALLRMSLSTSIFMGGGPATFSGGNGCGRNAGYRSQRIGRGPLVSPGRGGRRPRAVCDRGAFHLS